MSLLPKVIEDFSREEYWNTFFNQRGGKAFEWYGEFQELASYIKKYIKNQNDNILISGCGNSTLGQDLYDFGYQKITNIDISQVVIRQMLAQNKDRPNLEFVVMDALNTSFENESFNVVLDKGTLDALMPDNKPETVEKINKYFTEISRILKIQGRFVCISLLQEHILRILLEYFPRNNWMFRAVRCHDVEIKASENDESTMPVFVVVCTKCKPLPRMFLELNLSEKDERECMQRFDKTEDILSEIKCAQQFHQMSSTVRRISLQRSEVSFSIYSPGSKKPRFMVYIVDALKNRLVKYAAFIVPQGRETEYLFSTKDGRRKLLEQSGKHRLAIVTLLRGENYDNIEHIKKELNPVILNLAPVHRSGEIQFLTVGADHVGKRVIKVEGNSEYSGNYVVEDVEDQKKEVFRRLIYLNNQFVIQSEAKLKKKGSREIVDLTYLSCEHHSYMSIATNVACKDKSTSSVVIIGLGGGGLCSFLHKFMPKCKITGVDIDADMLQIATDWFGLRQDDNMNVVIADGLKFLADSAKNKQKFDAVLFDVDSKDSTIGMSCPPKKFLENAALNSINKVLTDTGLFILNMVQRDETLRPPIVEKLKSKFKTVVSYKLSEDLNEILICTRSKMDFDNLKTRFSDATKELNEFMKKNHQITCTVGLHEFINSLAIV